MSLSLSRHRYRDIARSRSPLLGFSRISLFLLYSGGWRWRGETRSWLVVFPKRQSTNSSSLFSSLSSVWLYDNMFGSPQRIQRIQRIQRQATSHTPPWCSDVLQPTAESSLVPKVRPIQAEQAESVYAASSPWQKSEIFGGESQGCDDVARVHIIWERWESYSHCQTGFRLCATCRRQRCQRRQQRQRCQQRQRRQPATPAASMTR